MILLGDCLERLKELDENSVDAVVTDPPYGLKFMNKDWDKGVPDFQLWFEVMRVMKPGAHLLSFGGTRTYHRMAAAIEDAGFEIRDQLQWIYGSGFPKSHNGAHGGTALKPANEPIVLARKPLSEKTVKANFEKWGVGGLNIDASRIGTEQMGGQTIRQSHGSDKHFGGGEKRNKEVIATIAQGRWPSNCLFDEEAAAMLDEQSGQFAGQVGMKKTGGIVTHQPGKSELGQSFATGKKDFGGASRFFYVAKASKRERNAGLEGMPEKDFSGGGGVNHPKADAYQARKSGVNFHPTVKPIKLMQYLIRLITPPDGIVLDPFMGSGSTGVAALDLGFDFIGIEMNEEYVQIAEKRMAAVK